MLGSANHGAFTEVLNAAMAHIDVIALVKRDQFTEVVVGRMPNKMDMKAVTVALIS